MNLFSRSRLSVERFFHTVSFTSVTLVALLALYGLVAVGLYNIENDSIINRLDDTPPRAEYVTDEELDKSWGDVQNITVLPHPYNSLQHGYTRDYLLDVIEDIMSNLSDTSFIEIVDHSYGSLVTKLLRDEGHGYWEGENIYAVINGTSDEPAILVSAHYDSVSTGYGATDNAIGAITLLQIFRRFSVSRPYRTLILNFNTGEEIELYGAAQFMTHPLAKTVDYFLNIDGAGAGGRAVILRGSNFQVLKAFNKSPYSFGTSFLQDFFKSGVIKSATDWSVYDSNGLKGIDIDFYKPRALYHTPFDTASSARKGSARYLIEITIPIVEYMTSDSLPNVNAKNANGEGSYYDLFGKYGLVWRRGGVITLAFLSLIFCPVIVGGLVYYLVSVQRILKLTKQGWFRFPISLFAIIAADLIVVNLILHANVGIIYSSDSPALLIALTTVITSMLFVGLSDYIFPCVSQLGTYLEIFTIHWIFALISVIYMLSSDINGPLIFILMYIGTFFAILINISPYLYKAYRSIRLAKRGLLPTRSSPSDPSPRSEQNEDASDEEDTLLVPTEQEEAYTILNESTDAFEALILIGEFFSAIFLPSITILQILFFSLNALRYGAAEGSWDQAPYLVVTLLSLLLVMNLTPFISRFVGLRGIFTFPVCAIVFVTFISLLSSTLSTFPYNSGSPLKVFIEQQIDYTVENSINWSDAGRMLIRGVPGYLEKIAYEIPTARASNNIVCTSPEKGELQECTWPALSMTPYISTIEDSSDLLTVQAEEDVEHAAYTLSVWVRHSRGGELLIPQSFFEYTGLTALSVEVLATPTYPYGMPVSSDSLTFNTTGPRVEFFTRCNFFIGQCDGTHPFRLRIKAIEGEDAKLLTPEMVSQITVIGYYDEWEPQSPPPLADPEFSISSSVNKTARVPEDEVLYELGRLPSIDELRHYMPRWSTFQKRSTGLVKVSKSVEYVDDEDFSVGRDATGKLIKQASN
ncbi:uncharacterized protein V1516DRAFT_645654 [Lipomyces oligophaga]|uniref:uncharacterized protein n=1 Tax=Lipomyces oligophaga TaxID=45792 RepID=UPI0034CFFC8C